MTKIDERPLKPGDLLSAKCDLIIGDFSGTKIVIGPASIVIPIPSDIIMSKGEFTLILYLEPSKSVILYQGCVIQINRVILERRFERNV